MNTMNRRIEIINILIIRRHTTANELAQELGVSIRTIQYDIQALSPQYPIYTKPGENGGLFIREDYNPHINSLTPMELENLREMCQSKFEQMAKDAKAIYKVDKLVLVNCDIFEQYLETFRLYV